MDSMDTSAMLTSSSQDCSSEPCSPDSFPNAQSLGDLDALPTEVVWMIFDDLLSREGFGHRGLCSLRRLSFTSKAASMHVSSYVNRQSESKSIQMHIEEAFLSSEARLSALSNRSTLFGIDVEPIEGVPGKQHDVITQAILDDCPDCFKWMGCMVPGMLSSGYNRAGWGYSSIAMYAGSIRILRYLYITSDSVEDCISLLTGPANALVPEKSVFSIFAQCRDLVFMRHVLDLVELRVFRRAIQPRLSYVVSGDDKYSLCTFITPTLASRLVQMGISLDGIWESHSGATCYHAAVLNGPPMLQWLEQYSCLHVCMRDHNSESPLHHAVRADRLDSVKWLRKHGGARTQWDILYPMPAELAATRSSNRSRDILEVLISTSSHKDYLDPFATGLLLRGVSRSLQQFSQAQDPESYPSRASYLWVLQQQEFLAIQKVFIIVRYSRGFAASVHDTRDPGSRYERGLHQYELAKSVAKSSGFCMLFDTLAEIA